MSPETETLLHTPLHAEHSALGARLVPFAGWEMSVQYAGIVEEHRVVREASGMFDVSHMGRFEVHGPEAGRFLRYLCTWDVASLEPGAGHYAAACREDGGILDDVYVFRLEDERWLIVVNAANAPKMLGWMASHVARFDARLVDRHRSTAMIAVQGPDALARLDAVVGAQFVRSLKPRRCGETDWNGQVLFASRTGYTGEDGLELVIDGRGGPALWRALLDADVRPCGLGARDTLRLEAALLLYGNDIDEATNPFEVGLDWVVTLDDGADFLGREALRRMAERGVGRQLVCLRALGRGIMRGGHAIRDGGLDVGVVTSGGFSPTLGVSIGLGVLPPALGEVGARLEVDVRGKPLPVEVVPRPFYKRPKKSKETNGQPA